MLRGWLLSCFSGHLPAQMSSYLKSQLSHIFHHVAQTLLRSPLELLRVTFLSLSVTVWTCVLGQITCL